jgi:hypothetical protein
MQAFYTGAILISKQNVDHSGAVVGLCLLVVKRMLSGFAPGTGRTRAVGESCGSSQRPSRPWRESDEGVQA